MVSTDRIDGLTTDVAIKAPVACATTENIKLSGTQTIDGVAVVADDRVLVKDQTDGVENGIYDVSDTAWARSKDFNGNRDIVQGTSIFVNLGTVNTSQNFNVDTANDIIIGTTSISITQHSSLHSDVVETMTNKTLNDDSNFIHADAVHIKSRNVSGGPFVKGQVIYESAYNNGQDAIEILLADADDATKLPALGIVDEGILNNANGSIVKLGTVTGDATDILDTTGGGEAWVVGNDLYVSTTPGALTNVRPTSATEFVQGIGTVLRVHATNGVIFVDGAGRVNDAPNLITMNAQDQWKKGADVASATALPVITDGNYFDVTGTTAITSFDTTGQTGTVIKLHFDGVLTLTHDAADLILPGGASITTAAGDEFEFIEYAAGDWRCTGYALASGEAIVGAGGGAIDIQTFTSSGTWTKPASGTTAMVECWAGGGSGGKGSTSSGAGGGGGGSYRIEFFDLASLGATETVTIGAGGAAQASASTIGNPGGETSLGALLSAFGGGGGGDGDGGGGGGGGQTSVGLTGSSTEGGTSGGPASVPGPADGLRGLFTQSGGTGAGRDSVGGDSQDGGGGGGGGTGSAGAATGVGGTSLNGGGGGGGAGVDTSGAAGGVSVNGGNGGAGSINTDTATSGAQPGGGGGGAELGTSGEGGDGQVKVTVW